MNNNRYNLEYKNLCDEMPNRIKIKVTTLATK